MRVALLSCGAGIASFPGPARFDVVVSVNDAATFCPSTHWSCGDAETWHRVRDDVLGSPVLWTHHDTARRLGNPPRLLTYARDERTPWTLWSVTAGLWLAGELGGRRVECFGLYEPGQESYFGTNPFAVRTPERWARERAAWDGVASELEGRGVEVVRL